MSQYAIEWACGHDRRFLPDRATLMWVERFLHRADRGGL